MSKKLAIAMFGQKRLSREGGVEIVVKELCTRMAQNGCDVTCYNRAGHHVSGAEYDDAGKTEYEGIRQKSVPTIERRGLAAVSSSAFAALYSAFGKYDVVHIHAEGPAFFAWLPKMFGKRVVVTVHGIDWQREKWQSGLGSKFIHQGEKNAAKYADEVIVLSKGVQDYFKETYGRETHFIPNGVNRPQIREASLITDKFGLKKDSYILFLGRLVPEKGIRYLVEAFKNVKTDKKLVIAGGSSDTDSFMEELKELAKGDDRILFTGFVQGAMLDELYSNAYIYTLPSDLEGMPLSLLEAMSYGNCCLVSDIPECTEVVEDTFIVDSDDCVTDDAVESILKIHKKYRSQNNICGYAFLRAFPDGKVNGKKFDVNEKIGSYIDVRVNGDDTGADKAEVFKTHCLKEFPFPEYPNEKFLGEDLVWVRMARKYEMVHINKAIYVGNYLEDGLTNNRRKHNIASPVGCMHRAEEFMESDLKTRYRIKGGLQYIVYGRFAGVKICDLIRKSRHKVLATACIPGGLFLHSRWSKAQ